MGKREMTECLGWGKTWRGFGQGDADARDVDFELLLIFVMRADRAIFFLFEKGVGERSGRAVGGAASGILRWEGGCV